MSRCHACPSPATVTARKGNVRADFCDDHRLTGWFVTLRHHESSPPSAPAAPPTAESLAAALRALGLLAAAEEGWVVLFPASAAKVIEVLRQHNAASDTPG